MYNKFLANDGVTNAAHVEITEELATSLCFIAESATTKQKWAFNAELADVFFLYLVEIYGEGILGSKLKARVDAQRIIEDQLDAVS